MVHPFFSFRKLKKTPSKMATDFLKSVLASFFSENELISHLVDNQLVMVLWAVLLARFVFPKLSDAISEAVRDKL